MLLAGIAILLSTFIILLMKVYIYAGYPSRKLDYESFEQLFPPKKDDPKKNRPRRTYEQAKAEYERSKNEKQDSSNRKIPKNLIEEAEEYLAKKKMEEAMKKNAGKYSEGSSFLSTKASFMKRKLDRYDGGLDLLKLRK